MCSQTIKIGICDDFPEAVKELKDKVEKCLLESGYHAEIKMFLSGQELLEEIEELDIVFLDIDMPEMDGIETGKMICSKNENCKIIIATGREDRFKEAFKINTFRFVSKPFNINEIKEALEDVWQTFIGIDTIELYQNRVLYSVEQKNIIYFYAYDSYVEAIVGTSKMRREISLAQLENLIDTRIFYRISRKYIVNLMHIDQYQNGTVYIRDEKLKVARARKKEFEKIYREFDVKYRRWG